MITFDFAQGSEQWLNIRTGIPTASQFHRILTAKTRKPSASADKYMCEKIAERWLGQSISPSGDGGGGFMARGTELERAAVTAYEFEHDIDTHAVGFILRDDRRVGGSPDRFVGEHGILEVKCVCARDHIGALLGMADDEHRSQCQGLMWLTGRAWTDLRFYNPDMPPATMRIERVEEHIEALAAAVDAFCDRLDAACEQLNVRRGTALTRDAGPTDRLPAARVIAEHDASGGAR